jgi:plasmid stabilization system protein ParE
MAKVIWTKPAVTDLAAAFDYIAIQSRSVDTAERICNDILDGSYERLETFPDSGAPVEALRHISAREIYIHSYRVIYVRRDDACYVIMCIHSSRDLARHLDPERWEKLP